MNTGKKLMNGKQAKRQRKLFIAICERNHVEPSPELFKAFLRNLKREGALPEFIQKSRENTTA